MRSKKNSVLLSIKTLPFSEDLSEFRNIVNAKKKPGKHWVPLALKLS
jgi:hypothetical protein